MLTIIDADEWSEEDLQELTVFVLAYAWSCEEE